MINSPLHPLLSRYAALQSAGFMNLMRSGGLEEMRVLEPQVTRLFEEGGVDLFIRARQPRPTLSPLPRGLSLPSTLSLQGRLGEEFRIDLEDSSGRAYVRLERIICAQQEISEDELEASYHRLNHGAAVMLSGIPMNEAGDSVLLKDKGGSYVVAARDRGDTHLLVQMNSLRAFTGRIVPSSPFELPIVDSSQTATRVSIYNRLIEKWERMSPAETLSIVEWGSTNPSLLRGFYETARLGRHPQTARVLFFLEMICRVGFARAGVPYPPDRCPVAVAGFGDEFETIRLLLDRGYPVIAVEDFETPVSSSGRPNITFKSVRGAFRDHPHKDRLRVFDFRDPELPKAQAQVVLFAAVVDEALPTLVHLVKPGGVVAATDVGQLGWRRQNFYVDSAESFVRSAGRQHAVRFSAVHSDVIQGAGALPSHFIHPLGHTAYIVRRDE